jgi:hypothetical protein
MKGGRSATGRAQAASAIGYPARFQASTPPFSAFTPVKPRDAYFAA